MSINVGLADIMWCQYLLYFYKDTSHCICMLTDKHYYLYFSTIASVCPEHSYLSCLFIGDSLGYIIACNSFFNFIFFYFREKAKQKNKG